MKVLIACEESQEVCKAFRFLGHEAYSCDVQEPSGGHPEWHILGPLDFAAGITLHKKRGDYVHKGESLATFYGAADKFEAAAAEYRSGLVYGAEKPEEAPLVYALVTKDGVERY